MMIVIVLLLLILPTISSFIVQTKLQCNTRSYPIISKLEMSDTKVPITYRQSYVSTLRNVGKLVSSSFFIVGGTVIADAAATTSTKPNFNDVRKDIEKLIEEEPSKGPTLVRLAWHSSGTYDKMSKTGGSEKGTIRFKEELAHGGNAGLNLPVGWLEPIYQKYHQISDLSYADLYTLAGVVAIKQLGGPVVNWRAGRVDSMDPKDVTPDGRLPYADKGSPEKTAQGLRDVFYRMGFNDKEIVALSGAHALGRCHATASGYVGPWTPTPEVFNNLYFVLLKGLKWTPNPKTKLFQYEDPSGRLMMLPSDIVLIQDSKFKTYVDTYAKDNKLFFADFSAAFGKLLELGTSNLYKV